jgi:hypothetical protein
MVQANTEALEAELEHFRQEKAKVRHLVGQIGGKANARRDRIINVLFVTAIVLLFSLDLMRHIFGLSIPLAPLLSIELGLLLVSLKIIWMIHRSLKVEHFQFWILNSIEFRLNDISRRIESIEKRVR